MSFRSVLIVLLAVFYDPGKIQAQCTNTTLMSSALDALLAEYPREEPPGKPVNVTMNLALRQVLLTDQGYLRILADLNLSWKDSRLSWNATQWGCNKTVVSAERVWIPDVELISGGESRAEGLRARLGSAGELAWPRRLDLAVPAAADVYNWPQDEYTADFKFASREHDLDEMVLIINYNNTQWSPVLLTSEWELMQASAKTSRVESGWGGAQGVVAWQVRVRRKEAAARVAARAGAAAAGALLAASGALPARDRTALHAAAALIATVCLFWSASNTGLSSGVPLVTRLSAALCVAAGAAALGAAVVARVARRGATPPQYLRAVLTRASTFCTLATTPNGEACEASWSAAAQLLDYIIQAAVWLLLIVVACLMI